MMDSDASPTPEALAQRLACDKARSLAPHVPDGAVILAADTIVVVSDGKNFVLLGQPADRSEAERMLRRLVNGVHRVVTGVALEQVGETRHDAFADVAQVRLGMVDEVELQRYLDSEAWRGKAGGYNLQELRDRWPFEVSGDETTVIGLPMVMVTHHLRAWGVHPDRKVAR